MASTITQLTPALIRDAKLPDGVDDFYFRDRDRKGLSLRLQRDCRPAFYTYYRIGPKQRRVKIGDASVLTIEQAWAETRRIQAEVTLGRDPQADKEAAKKAAHALAVAKTFADAAELYLADKRALLARKEYRRNSMVRIEHELGTLAAPLDDRPLAEISRTEIKALLTEVSNKRGPFAARNLKMTLSGLFKFCIVELEITEVNPTIGIKVAAAPEREHELTDAELVAIHRACEDPALGDYGVIVRVLCRLPLRRQEIGSLRHDELDWDEHTVSISADRAKNKRKQILAMPTQVEALLRAVPDRDRPVVFGRIRDTGFSGWSRSKQELDQRLTDVRSWHLHDLRRTISGRLAAMGIKPIVIESALNHRDDERGGLAKVYRRYEYFDEVADALQRWNDQLDAMLAGKAASVTRLRKAAR